ncbi:hypothetical protein BSKO_06415 [Bryopsis sp. KO-2023]|nr:hypothetical protein BSKO_06415 [Bryopsis sp. KO-2023]
MDATNCPPANCPPANEELLPNNKLVKGAELEERQPQVGKSRPYRLTIPESLAGCISREDWLQMASSLDKEFHSPNESLQECPSSTSCDMLLSMELEHLLSPEITGRCVVCYTYRPTWAAWPCGHVPFCELCATETLRSVGDDGGTGVSFNLIKCPLCRQHAYLNRIYLPEDSGSQEGMCFQCERSKAVVVVNGCCHLSLCEECTNGEKQVKCPICNSNGQALKIFRPE